MHINLVNEYDENEEFLTAIYDTEFIVNIYFVHLNQMKSKAIRICTKIMMEIKSLNLYETIYFHMSDIGDA